MIQSDLGHRPSRVHRPGRTFLAVLALTTLSPAPNQAEGFRNPPPGAFNLGRAGGRIAQIDDASANTQNPANLTDLPSTQVLVAPSLVYIRVKYDSAASGQNAETEDPVKVLPNIFLGVPFAEGRMAAGLGITTPYGISQDWKEDEGAFMPMTGTLRYATPRFAELKTIQMNPSFAMKLGEHVQLGVGLDVMWSELTLEQFYPWFAFPIFNPANLGDPDGVAKLKGQGVGVGGNFGVTWQITPRQRVAATVRSPIRVDYDGDFDISHVPGRAAPFGVTSESDFSTHVTFPTIVSLGYGIQLGDRWRVEVDGEWIQFSKFESLDLDVENNAILFPTTDIPQKWKNTFTIGIGADYKVSPHWIIRGGYQFYESPVPGSTFSPTIPDADQNVFTLGVHYRLGRHSLEAAYGLDLYDHREINHSEVNPAFNGDYRTTVHLFAFQYGYSF
jgi:long-chain fatty acid transport protein